MEPKAGHSVWAGSAESLLPIQVFRTFECYIFYFSGFLTGVWEVSFCGHDNDMSLITDR
jgi:hypothetical protein